MKFGQILKESKFDYYKKIAKDEEREIKNIITPKEYGIFIWNKDNKYPKEDAIKTFKSEKKAESALEKMGKFDYVIRGIF